MNLSLSFISRELFEINVDEMLIVWNHNLLSGLDSLLRTGLKNSTNYPLKTNSFSKQRKFWAKWQNCDSLIFNTHRQGFTRSGGNNKLLFPKIFQQPDNSKDTSATRFFTNQMIKKNWYFSKYISAKKIQQGRVTWLHGPQYYVANSKFIISQKLDKDSFSLNVSRKTK